MEAQILFPRSPLGLSHCLLGFLDEHFKLPSDLWVAPSLEAQLARECGDLESRLLELRRELSIASDAWLDGSNEVRRILGQLDLDPDASAPFPSRGLPPTVRRILDVELIFLAKEVRRIETVRSYAETTLQLEVLVGDLEDAAISIVSQTSRNLSFSLSKASRPTDTWSNQEKLLLAVKAMKDIEKVLEGIMNNRMRWSHLFMAVDSRVENILAVLRPQARTDHRALLAILGWPPSLSTSNLERDKGLEIPNPLILMQGEKKEKYSQSFLALCALQHLQAQREARKHDLSRYQNEYKISDSMDLNKETCFNCALWTIDELVHPIASRMEYHFSRWSDQPKFIFMLVYKVTRDFLDGVDCVLQPLIDQARLVGYSAKEAWVSAMIKVLLDYLAREVFPVLFQSYNSTDGNMEVISSWLHLVDLMITFDNRMRVLASSRNTQIAPFMEFDASLSVLSMFNEHPDWLQIWAEIELKDSMNKLKSDLEDERCWSIDFRQQAEIYCKEEAELFVLSTREDYKAPLIADVVVRMAWAMIERGQALPNKQLRVQFIQSSASKILKQFFVILLQRCQEPEIMTAITENEALLRVAASMNILHYSESILREWSEDVNFLEMSIGEDNFTGTKEYDQHSQGPFFGEEITYLVKLETDYLVEIASALLLRFDTLSWDYIKNVEQWEVEQVESEANIFDEENLSVSPTFVESLDMLNDRVRVLKLNLNSKDFVDLWRSIAGGLDRFIFSSIILSDARFSVWGINQFKVDMRALFLVFRSFCARPEAFFPFTNDSLKLLTVNREDVVRLLNITSNGKRKMEECLQARGLFHVSAAQADKILRKMKLVS